MQLYLEPHGPEKIKSCVGRFKLLLDQLPVPNVWVAGGAIRKYFDGSKGGDTDVFFRLQSDYDLAVNRFVGEKIWDAKVIYENDNVKRVGTKYGIIDFVKRYFESAEQCIKQFDFTVACAAVIKGPVYGFLHHDTFFIDMASRSLVVNALPYPLSTLSRIQKYNKKGYTICNGGLLSIAKELQKINLEQPNQNTLSFYPDGRPKFVGVD